MKLQKIDFSVAIFSGLACFTLAFEFPVWALFFGWAWYGPLGGTLNVFKKAIPSMLLGYAMASISIIAFALSGGTIWIMVVFVAITVFIIMLSTKTKIFAAILPSFNAYSCMFAGYYALSFPHFENSSFLDLNNILICIGWLALANIVGLVFGFASTKLATLGEKNNKD